MSENCSYISICTYTSICDIHMHLVISMAYKPNIPCPLADENRTRRPITATVNFIVSSKTRADLKTYKNDLTQFNNNHCLKFMNIFFKAITIRCLISLLLKILHWTTMNWLLHLLNSPKIKRISLKFH